MEPSWVRGCSCLPKPSKAAVKGHAFYLPPPVDVGSHTHSYREEAAVGLTSCCLAWRQWNGKKKHWNQVRPSGLRQQGWGLLHPLVMWMSRAPSQGLGIRSPPSLFSLLTDWGGLGRGLTSPHLSLLLCSARRITATSENCWGLNVITHVKQVVHSWDQPINGPINGPLASLCTSVLLLLSPEHSKAPHSKHLFTMQKNQITTLLAHLLQMENINWPPKILPGKIHDGTDTYSSWQVQKTHRAEHHFRGGHISHLVSWLRLCYCHCLFVSQHKYCRSLVRVEENKIFTCLSPPQEVSQQERGCGNGWCSFMICRYAVDRL